MRGVWRGVLRAGVGQGLRQRGGFRTRVVQAPASFRSRSIRMQHAANSGGTHPVREGAQELKQLGLSLAGVGAWPAARKHAGAEVAVEELHALPDGAGHLASG